MASLRKDVATILKLDTKLRGLDNEAEVVRKRRAVLAARVERTLANGAEPPKRKRRRKARRKKTRRRRDTRGAGLKARGAILTALRSAKKPVSGSDLAKKAKTSKMTVNRQIDALRKEGHRIKGRRGVGYSLRKRRAPKKAK